MPLTPVNLALTFLVSLPTGRDPNGAVRYPAADLPFAGTLQGSRLVVAGRAILRYPLMERRGRT